MRRYLRGGVVRRSVSRRPGIRGASALAILVGALTMVFAVGLASGAPGPEAFGLGAPNYKALSDPAETPSGFEQPVGFDDTGWATAQAPFASSTSGSPGCGFPQGNTLFASGGTGTIYLRRPFTLPDNAFGLHIVGTVDNNADVWVNGTSQGATIESGFCNTNAIDLHVPNSDLNHGDSNLVAVKAVGLDAGSPSFFDMQANYGTLEITQQPTETEKGSPITPAPAVTITDADGNPVSGASVDVSLETIAGSGTLSGTTSKPTVGGVATFDDLVVNGSGKYRLVFASEGATAKSNAFLIDDQITPCQGSSCSAQGSNAGTTVEASSTNAAGNSLAVSVFDISPPAGACDPLTPLGVGSFVNVLGNGGAHPDLTLTWRLDKSLVLQAGNPGAAHFDICLGAVNLDHKNGGVDGWTTKSGGQAVPFDDPDLGVTLYWGIAPDCAKKGTPTGPCVLHRNKNKGDEVIDVFKPYPWDGRMYGG